MHTRMHEHTHTHMQATMQARTHARTHTHTHTHTCRQPCRLARTHTGIDRLPKILLHVPSQLPLYKDRQSFSVFVYTICYLLRLSLDSDIQMPLLQQACHQIYFTFSRGMTTGYNSSFMYWYKFFSSLFVLFSNVLSEREDSF